jgi:PII-like signaling protein
MTLSGEQFLLRIFLRSSDQYHFAPAYERIMQHATHHQLAGATTLPAIMGLGRRGIVHAAPTHWTNDAPVVVELVDSAEHLTSFAQDQLPPIIPGALATIERAAVLRYRPRAGFSAGPLTLPPSAASPLTSFPTWENPAMTANQDGQLLRIFIGESDTAAADPKLPLYHAIVKKARELGMAGATVFRGSIGFGANSVLHTSKILTLSTDLPIVIEIVDSVENIQNLLPHLDPLINDGMVTLESVRILTYRQNPNP